MVLKIILIVIIFVLIISGITYWLFFTKHFQIISISINGLKTGNNILFFDSERLNSQLMDKFPVLKSVTTRKEYFHKLSINLVEREPVGIWCLSPLAGGGCHYFDNNKVAWGELVKSSGFLFLTVEDQRSKISAIDSNFFDGIMKVLNNSSQSKFKIQNVVIPDGSFDEFRVYTDKSYYLIFSLNSDISSQMQVLDIFLNEKSKDPNFNPQYLDLRIDGRVYYK